MTDYNQQRKGGNDEAAQKPKRDIEIDLPQPGIGQGARPNIVTGDAIRVEGTAWRNGAADLVRAHIYGINEQPPFSPPDASETTPEIQPDQGNGRFTLTAVPGAACSQSGTANRLAVWGQFGTEWTPPHIVDFQGQCQPVQIAVSATTCLWFAWAPDDDHEVPASRSGTSGNSTDRVGDHRPMEVAIPWGAKSVAIEANSDDRWAHHPGKNTDANGRSDKSVGLERPEYKTDALRSNNIADQSDNCNKLVGMWADGDEPWNEPTTPMSIGMAESGLEVLPSYRMLILGFHDGRQWSNNEGAVNVSITWSNDG